MPDASHSDSTRETVAFEWSHGGSNVSIAGSFDDPYSPWVPIPMTKLDGRSDFVISLDLKSSTTYYYKFVVDGNWVLDQNVSTHPDSSGNYNHVIFVEPQPPATKSDNEQDEKKEDDHEWQIVQSEETPVEEPITIDQNIITEIQTNKEISDLNEIVANDITPSHNNNESITTEKETTNDVAIVSSLLESQREVENPIIENAPEVFVVDTPEKIEVTGNDPVHEIVDTNEVMTEKITHEVMTEKITHDNQDDGEIFIKDKSFPNESQIETHEDPLTELLKNHDHSIPTPDQIVDTNGIMTEKITHDNQDSEVVQELESEISIKDKSFPNESQIETHEVPLATELFKDHDHSIPTPDQIGDLTTTSDNPVNNANGEEPYEENIGNSYETIFKETIDETVKTTAIHEISLTDSSQHEEKIETVDTETMEENFVNETIDETVKTFEQTFQDNQGSTNDLVDTTNLETIDETVKTLETTLKDSIENFGKHPVSTSITDPSSMSPYKACFSYKNDDINVVCIDDNLRVKIERLSADIARVYFTDIQDFQVPIPATITFWDLSNNQALIAFNNNFIITCISNYVMYQSGNEIFRLERQRQQTIETALTTYVIH